MVDVAGNSLTVSASIRYKPENPEEHDIDGDYTESQLYDAFQIVDIDPVHAQFIKEYSQCVVENHNDVTGFYMHDTTNINPLQRLRDDLEIPNYDEFEDAWERYEAARYYANNVDEDISAIENEIGSLFYILFGLN